jgi:hypothetical protein
MRKIFFLFLIIGTSSVAFAQEAPPCWDRIPPSEKYAQKHVVQGDTAIVAPADSEMSHNLIVDGLSVATKMIDGEAHIEVEVAIKNCSSKTVEINPHNFGLDVVDPTGERQGVSLPGSTRTLTPLDPTQIIRDSKTGTRFPAIVPQTLEYGHIAFYRVFFARDGNAKSSDFLHSNYRLALGIPIEAWLFGFNFPRVRR